MKRLVLVPATKPEKLLNFGSKARTVLVDRADSRFYSEDKIVAVMSVKPALATIEPRLRNPDRINIYREPNDRGLRLWTYKGQESQVFIGYGGEFIRMQKETIPVLRIALRKYTRMKIQFVAPKPRPSGVDYEPPPDKDRTVSKR